MECTYRSVYVSLDDFVKFPVFCSSRVVLHRTQYATKYVFDGQPLQILDNKVNLRELYIK